MTAFKVSLYLPSSSNPCMTSSCSLPPPFGVPQSARLVGWPWIGCFCCCRRLQLSVVVASSSSSSYFSPAAATLFLLSSPSRFWVWQCFSLGVLSRTRLTQKSLITAIIDSKWGCYVIVKTTVGAATQVSPCTPLPTFPPDLLSSPPLPPLTRANVLW